MSPDKLYFFTDLNALKATRKREAENTELNQGRSRHAQLQEPIL